MTINPVLPTQKEEAIALLQKANLPVEDIQEQVALYTLNETDTPIGTVGLEHEGDVGLLRSLSINEGNRSKGYGDQLVQFIESVAKEKGVQTMYLLTTTAVGFFAKRGYEVTQRTEVPAFIRQTSEFSAVCPSTAIIMKKVLL